MISKRRRAREMAVQMLYQSDLGATSWREVVESFDPLDHLAVDLEEGRKVERPRPARKVSGDRGAGDRGADGKGADGKGEGGVLHDAFLYARQLVQGTLENLEAVDGLIREQAANWRLERMSAVDRNILRLAVYELLFETEVPKLVVVDEAIELAKKYGSERSSKFINGLLDGLIRSHTFPGSLR